MFIKQIKINKNSSTSEYKSVCKIAKKWLDNNFAM